MRGRRCAEQQRFPLVTVFRLFGPSRTSPSAPITFQFDQSLIEDTLGNKLQPNALLVDNLTVDWLRGRLADLETALKECDEKQARLLASDAAGEAAASVSASSSSALSTSSSSAASAAAHNGSLPNGNGSARDAIKCVHNVNTKRDRS